MPLEVIPAAFLVIILTLLFLIKERRQKKKGISLIYQRGFISLSLLFILLTGLFSFDIDKNSRVLMHLPFVAEPWPRDISYYNNSSYNKTLQLAIERWQETGIPISFYQTREKEKADIIIEDRGDLLEKHCLNEGCRGHARIGYTSFDWRENKVLLSPLDDEEKSKENDIVSIEHLPTVIHELGHVLGLDHNNDSCSLMNEKSICRHNPRLKISNSGTSFACGPFRDDLLNLSELYDFSAKKITPFCFDQKANWDYYIALSQR